YVLDEGAVPIDEQRRAAWGRGAIDAEPLIRMAEHGQRPTDPRASTTAATTSSGAIAATHGLTELAATNADGCLVLSVPSIRSLPQRTSVSAQGVSSLRQQGTQGNVSFFHRMIGLR